MNKISKNEKSRFRSMSSVLPFLTHASYWVLTRTKQSPIGEKISNPTPITPEMEPVRRRVRIINSSIPLLVNDLPFTSFFLTVLIRHGVLAPLDSHELAISVHLMKQLIDRISISSFGSRHDFRNVQPFPTGG
jgi:hypothetical protein